MVCEIRSVISWLRQTESHEAAGRARHALVFKDDVTIESLVLKHQKPRQGEEHIHRVDDTRNPTQDGQTNVDQEVRAASALQEDAQRRQDDGEDDLADVTVRASD